MKKRKKEVAEPEKEFKTMEYVRGVRDELGKLFFRDKEEYLRQVRQAGKDFDALQKKMQDK
jgi:intein-encoded DNA endonuclease-like protein